MCQSDNDTVTSETSKLVIGTLSPLSVSASSPKNCQADGVALFKIWATTVHTKRTFTPSQCGWDQTTDITATGQVE